MKKAIIITAILLSSASANAADKWSTRDKGLELSYQILHFIDWRQTRYIAKNPEDYYEMNPVLGKHPSTYKVDAYFIGTAIVHPIITHFLPQKYRPWWQAVTITMSGTCVINNYFVGIKMDF